MPTGWKASAVSPAQSAELAKQIAAMPPGNFKHRCFDDLVNAIARQHGHGEAVDIFEANADGAAYHADDAA